MTRQQFLLPALFGLTFLRVCLLPLHGLSPIESHILDCAHRNDFWHVGMGPLIPLLVKISSAVFGDTEVGVRFFAPLLVLGASLLLWELAKGLFDSTVAAWSMVLFQMVPLVNVAAITMTPTTLGLVLSISLLCALRLALHRSHPWHVYWWTVGVTMMLAVLADWRLAMLAVSVAASLAVTSRGRRALLKWPVLPLLGGCISLIATLFLAWNSEHDWRALAPLPGVPLPTFQQSVYQCLLVFSPALLAAFIWTLSRARGPKSLEYPVAFLFAFAWPLITLDLICWNKLPWPMAGLGAWVAPVTLPLVYHSMTLALGTARQTIWLRGLMLMAVALQTCALLVGDLPRLLGFPW